MPVEANCIKRTQGRKELCLTVEVKALTVARRKRERLGPGLSLRDNQPRVGWGAWLLEGCGISATAYQVPLVVKWRRD